MRLVMPRLWGPFSFAALPLPELGRGLILGAEPAGWGEHGGQECGPRVTRPGFCPY